MSEKAEGRSVSFKPAWLYDLAESYGKNLEKPENVSEVVCGFLRDGLINAGVEMPKSSKRTRKQLLSPDVARAIAEARAHGIDPVDAIQAAIAHAQGQAALDAAGQEISPLLSGGIQTSTKANG